jgi:ketosteroid isomerase-like protein
MALTPRSTSTERWRIDRSEVVAVRAELARRDRARRAMTTNDRIRTIFATFDAKDVSALAAFMTDDVRLRLGNAEAVQGKPAFVEAVNTFLASVGGFRHEVLNVWSNGDALIAEFDVHYTRLDGGEVTLPCCNVFRLRDGLVAEYRSYIDATPVYA